MLTSNDRHRLAGCTRLLPALVSLAILCTGLGACGNATVPTSRQSTDTTGAYKGSPSTVSRTTASGAYLKNDGDKDSDDVKHRGTLPDDHDDHELLAPYGPEADRAERHAVAIVVKRYYEAAAAGDGVQACALLDKQLAEGLVEAGQAARTGCATSLTRLFAEDRKQLAAEKVATMVVTGVHVKGDLGIALLGFSAAPESEILVEREGRAWKLGALFGAVIP